MKVRKKPIEVEAVLWDGINLSEVKNFVGEKLQYDIYDLAWEVGMGVPKITMQIDTLKGLMKVSIGDYIIKGIQGEFYPCKPDIFHKTYDILS